MGHFQRVQYQIAPHYLHAYATAPRGVHPLMPLMPYGTGAAYGDPYGRSVSDFIAQAAPEWAGGRKSLETLRRTGANTAVYAAYDNFKDLDATITQKVGGGRNYTKNMTDLSMISTWPDMTTVAASNSGAQLKTAYLLWLAGKVALDDALMDRAAQLAEAGKKAGESQGAGGLTSDIARLYSDAVDILNASKAGSNALVQRQILPQLQKGAGQKAVEDRQKQYRKQQDTVRENIPTDEGGTQKSWWDEMGDAAKYGLYGVAALTVLGTGFWAYGRYKKAAKENPQPRRRSNPSAPGRTDSGPEEDIANLPKAREQEKRLMQNVFNRKV